MGKPGQGGRKWAVRHRDEHVTRRASGSACAPDPGPLDRELLGPLVVAGEIVGREGAKGMEAARAMHGATLAELPPYALQLSRGYPAIPTVFDPDGDEIVAGRDPRRGHLVTSPDCNRLCQYCLLTL